MLKFVAFAVKVQLNVHDLNNETVAGNVTDIRIMEFLDENGKRRESPAVSGRMLKHWHLEGMRNLIINGPYSSIPMCQVCKIGEPIRPGKIEKGNHLVQIAKSEEGAVGECVVCDIHGYLIAQEAKEESAESKKEKGVSTRRISRAMFSWLTPVLGYETTSKQVIHSRVSQQRREEKEEQASQMIFNKSYASGFYAFVSALDVDRIGFVELKLGSNDSNDLYVVNSNERKKRIKVAIEAYRLMLSGQIGASLSHAIPHVNPIEVLVAYSENGPLPFPVSPIYSDYITKTIGLMPSKTNFLYWGNNDLPSGIIKKTTINEIFDEILNKIE